MGFNFLDIVNRILMMHKQPTISNFDSVVIGDDAYKAQLCANDTVTELFNLLRIPSNEVSFQFDTVAGQRVYTLPRSVDLPLISLTQRIDDIKLAHIDRFDYDKYVVDPTEHTDNPKAYYFEGYSAVDVQPSVGDAFTASYSGTGLTLSMVSQSSQYNHVSVSEYSISTGITTLIGAGSSYEFKILSLSVSAYPDNVIVFSNNEGAGATKYFAYMGKQEKTIQNAQIGLHPIPTSVITIYGRGYRRAFPMVNEYDYPLGFTPDLVNVVTLGSYARYLRYQPSVAVESINQAFDAYYEEIRKITASKFRNPDGMIRMKSASEYVPATYFRPLDRWTR